MPVIKVTIVSLRKALGRWRRLQYHLQHPDRLTRHIPSAAAAALNQSKIVLDVQSYDQFGASFDLRPLL